MSDIKRVLLRGGPNDGQERSYRGGFAIKFPCGGTYMFAELKDGVAVYNWELVAPPKTRITPHESALARTLQIR